MLTFNKFTAIFQDNYWHEEELKETDCRGQREREVKPNPVRFSTVYLTWSIFLHLIYFTTYTFKTIDITYFTMHVCEIYFRKSIYFVNCKCLYISQIYFLYLHIYYKHNSVFYVVFSSIYLYKVTFFFFFRNVINWLGVLCWNCISLEQNVIDF